MLNGDVIDADVTGALRLGKRGIFPKRRRGDPERSQHPWRDCSRAGNMFIADFGNHHVRKVDGIAGVITTVAGIGRRSEIHGLAYAGNKHGTRFGARRQGPGAPVTAVR